MRIAVFGTGGVGGYFGARLAASGEDVTFIARGSHLAAIRKDGLKVASANGDVTVKPAKATDDIASIGPVDIVMLCTKLWDLDEAAAQCKPLVAKGGCVIPFQNGVDAMDRAAAALGKDKVVGGVAYIAAIIGEPGVIKHTGTMARIVFGEADGLRSPRVEAFLAACKKAGIDADIPPSIAVAQWRKFMLLASASGWTSVTRQPFGVIRADQAIRAGLRDAIAEIHALAWARGVAIPPESIDETMATVDKMPAEMKTSMSQDLERGNRLEVPWLSGAVARLGHESGVPTPVHATLAAALRPYQDGAKK